VDSVEEEGFFSRALQLVTSKWGATLQLTHNNLGRLPQRGRRRRPG